MFALQAAQPRQAFRPPYQEASAARLHIPEAERLASRVLSAIHLAVGVDDEVHYARRTFRQRDVAPGGELHAHLRKLPVEYEPWHPKAVYYYFLPPTLMPTFVVDITGYQDDYFAAIMAHESQFGRPGINEMIRNYFEGHITRWARWAGGKYAMAFYSDWPLRMDDPLAAAQARNPEGKQHE